MAAEIDGEQEPAALVTPPTPTVAACDDDDDGRRTVTLDEERARLRDLMMISKASNQDCWSSIDDWPDVYGNICENIDLIDGLASTLLTSSSATLGPQLGTYSIHQNNTFVGSNITECGSLIDSFQTAELVERCQRRDNTSYTIAFMENQAAGPAIAAEAAMADDRKLSEAYPLPTVSNRQPILDFSQERKAENDSLVQSEYAYTTWSRLKRGPEEEDQGNDAEISDAKLSEEPIATLPRPKESHSMPNIVQVANQQNNNAPPVAIAAQAANVNTYRYGTATKAAAPLGAAMAKPEQLLPVFDLNSSHSSHTLSTPADSPPRSLIRLYYQNRLSLSSSGQMSSSVSLSQSQDSDGQNGAAMAYALQRPCLREPNNNNYVPLNALDEELLTLPKMPSRMKQTSPIKEEDELLTDSSRADVTMTSAIGAEDLYQRRPSGSTSFDQAPNVRPTSHDWLRRTAAAYATPAGYKPSHRAPPAQVYMQKQMQTAQQPTPQMQGGKCLRRPPLIGGALSKASTAAAAAAAAPPSATDDQKKASLYVCYPNYSLPDLSFLNGQINCNSGTSTPRVILSPTKPLHQPLPQTRPDRFRKPPRPRSLNDFEQLAADREANFGHIKDWDSLNVLLPDEIRQILGTAKGHLRSQGRRLSSEDDANNDSDEDFRQFMERLRCDDNGLNNNGVRMRYSASSRNRRRENSNAGCTCGETANRRAQFAKRYSLQEPFYNPPCPPRTPMTPTGPPCSSGGRFMTRSETMPFPCMATWTPTGPPAHMCYYQHYHPCCMAMMSPCMSIDPRQVDTSSELCELLSMDNTLQEVTSLLNRTSQAPSPGSTTANSSNLNSQCSNKKQSSTFSHLKHHWQHLADSLNEPDTSLNVNSAPATRQQTKTNPARPIRANSKVLKASNHKANGKVDSKPAIATKSPQVILRQKSMPVVNGKPQPAKRPASLHAPNNFRSLIPVPKSKVTSPVGSSKKLT